MKYTSDHEGEQEHIWSLPDEVMKRWRPDVAGGGSARN